MTESLKDYIRPELLSVVPALYLSGAWLKQSSRVKDEHIPLLLGAAGVLLAAVYMLSVTEINGYRDVLSAFFAAATQGALCAGAAVYWHQLVHQGQKLKALEKAEHEKDENSK